MKDKKELQATVLSPDAQYKALKILGRLKDVKQTKSDLNELNDRGYRFEKPFI